jgi:Acyltransferase family
MTRPARSRIRDLAAGIDEATPASRDRTVDALRALAIAGVILGHWLVTALVLTQGAKGDALHDASPLASMPWLTPLSWIFQTLAIFFFVGGYSSARSYRVSPRGDGSPSNSRRGGSSAGTSGYRAWLGRRLARLSRPVMALVAVWALLGTGLYLGGVSTSTLHTVLVLVLDPLWFLGVYAGLTALTPLALALVRRLGAWAALIPFTVVAVADAVRFGLGGPAWVGWVNVAAGWLVPYLLGMAWARGAFRGRRTPALMLAGGIAATAALVLWAGYPASMVGVNGAKISNLNPPTLAVVTFGIAQVGLALLLRERLARWMRRPVAWAAVATANLSAMTLFLWSQTAFLIVTMAGLAVGRLPGLHTAPTTPVWIAERIAWLPVFAVALAVLWVIFRRVEQAPRPRQSGRAVPAVAEPRPTPVLQAPPGLPTAAALQAAPDPQAAPGLPTAAAPHAAPHAQATPCPAEERADASSLSGQAGVLARWPRSAATEEDG